MTTIESTNQDMYQTIADDSSITVIEKQVGRTTTTDISEALEEYKRLFKAGIASDAETLTLSRAYPNDPVYRDAASRIETEPVVIGGPASVSLIDREGHLITTDALEKAFKQYMSNFRTRNTMVLHSDVQVGWALPAYISKSGDVFKSGVDEKGLFFVTEIRNDTKIAKKVLDQIDDGKLKSYSIAGSATKTQNKTKGLMPYMQVDEMELAEITVCERGVNQAASFDILKGHDAATHTCTDGSCLMDNPTPTPKEPLELIMKADGNIDFVNSFAAWVEKEDLEKGILTSTAKKIVSGAQKLQRGAQKVEDTATAVTQAPKRAKSAIRGAIEGAKIGARHGYTNPSTSIAQRGSTTTVAGPGKTGITTRVGNTAKKIDQTITSAVQGAVDKGKKLQRAKSIAAAGQRRALRGNIKSALEGPKVTTPSTSTRKVNYDTQTGKPLSSSASTSKKLTPKYPRPSMSRMGGGSTPKNSQLRLLDYDIQKAGLGSAFKNLKAGFRAGVKSGLESPSAKREAPKNNNLEKADKKQLGSGKPLKWVEPRSAQYGPKTNDSKTNRPKTIRPGKPLIWHDVELKSGSTQYGPGSIEKAGWDAAYRSARSKELGTAAKHQRMVADRRTRSTPLQERKDIKWSKAPSKRLEGQGPATTVYGQAPLSSKIHGDPASAERRDKKGTVSLDATKRPNVSGAKYAPYGPGNIEKGAFLAAIPAALGVAGKVGSKVAGKTLAVGGKAAAKGTAKLAAKGAKAGAKKVGSSMAPRPAPRSQEADDYQTKSVDLLLDFVEKAQFESGTKKKSPMISPEAKPNVGKIEHQQHDQDQKDSENAFTLQDKETDVVFQKLGPSTPAIDENTVAQPSRNKQEKDEDIEKQEDNLVTEYSTEQIEKDTELVMADSQVPSTPSMGWFDMLKEELKADVLTDIEMTKSYPDWQQDPEAYSEHREIIKNKITEGYK